MATIIEDLDIRLGYKESLTISRDEYDYLINYVREGEDMCVDYVKEIEEMEGNTKQRDTAVEILESIIECIDDEGVVTPGDKKLLVRRIKSALKFIDNVCEG